jgi:hypothetical protein
MLLPPITIDADPAPQQQVDLNPTPESSTISLNAEHNQGVFPSPDVASMRAAKATIGLGPVTGAN